MTEQLYTLIKMLADGRFHSGEELGAVLGIGRSAVWKNLQELSKYELDLHAVTGKGYRLSQPIELLDRNNIETLLSLSPSIPKPTIELFSSIDSTSQYLKRAAELSAPTGMVCISEHQTSGRGRRGRRWQSPYGSNLYLSLLWRFNEGMSHLTGLSLAVAVMLMRAFQELGAVGLGIKWPNDIHGEHGKLAGILLDVSGESAGPCHAVIGIGVNYSMPQKSGNEIDQPWTDLTQCKVTEGRNSITAVLLQCLLTGLASYQTNGFEPFRSEWKRWDILTGKNVSLHTSQQVIDGIARGIDDTGMLVLEVDGKIRTFAAGDVSTRASVS